MDRVVYGYDPLCGWCFGFGPAFAQVRDELAGEVEFVLACGGQVVGERVRAVRHDAGYLRAGLAQVETVTGVRAGPGFAALLERGTWVSDSEPVCRALWVARELGGDAPAIDLGAALCRAFYVDGDEPDVPQVLQRHASAAGLDGAELVRRWATPGARRGTAEWFAESRAAGVGTYPSLLVPDATGALHAVLEGVAPAAEVVERIRRALAATAAR